MGEKTVAAGGEKTGLKLGLKTLVTRIVLFQLCVRVLQYH